MSSVVKKRFQLKNLHSQHLKRVIMGLMHKMSSVVRKKFLLKNLKLNLQKKALLKSMV